MFSLLPAWTLETGLSLEIGIPELWETPVPVISGTFTDSVCSSLPHHGPGEPVSVPRCYIDPFYFTIRLNGLGYGLRSKPRLTSRDFMDTGACLRHHTSYEAYRSVGHLGYISTLSLMGESVI